VNRRDLLTAEDAALLTGVDRATLRDWTRRGLLPRYGSPRCALYHWHDLAAAKNAAKPRRTERDGGRAA
jgi:predicted site-specific integrase-resolvase